MANIKKTTNDQKKVVKTTEPKKTNLKKKGHKKVLEKPGPLSSFPEIDTSEVVSCIEECFQGMKKISFKPPWNFVRSHKNKHKEFFEAYSADQKKKALAKDPKLQEKIDSINALWSEIIIGFNAVMRNLEKGNIAAIITEKNSKPASLSETFLPICNILKVPICPIKNFQKKITADHLLGLSTSCLVLGLKNCVKKPSSKFHVLYKKICAISGTELNEKPIVIELNDTIELSSDVEMEEKVPNGNIKSKKRPLEKEEENEAGFTLLKRPDKKSRMFIPPRLDGTSTNTKTSQDKEFIGVSSDDSKTGDAVKDLSKSKLKAKPRQVEQVTLSDAPFFTIDEDPSDDDEDVPKNEDTKKSEELSQNGHGNNKVNNDDDSSDSDIDVSNISLVGQNKPVKRKLKSYEPATVKEMKEKPSKCQVS